MTYDATSGFDVSHKNALTPAVRGDMSGDILDSALIARRYFFPRWGPLEEPFKVKLPNGAVLGCHLHRPHPGARTLVHFHGNGEVVADYLGDFLASIAGLGLNCLLVEYRGYGASTGVPALSAMLDDVEVVLEALGEPPERVVLFGRSVGSIYAVHAASCWPKIAGLIIESGIADPLERILLRVRPEELGVTAEALEAAAAARLDHRQKLAAFQGSTLIMHARHDDLVDVSHAERLYDWAPEPRTLKVFDRGDHNSILYANLAEYFTALRGFLSTLPPH